MSWFFSKKLQKGQGGIYVVGILAAIMGASYFMTGGLLPEVERIPEDAQVVQVEDTLTADSRASLQLVNIHQVTPSLTPTGNPNSSPTPSPTGTLACFDNTAIAILVDVSGSMADPASAGSNERKIDVLKRALATFLTNLSQDTIVGLFAFSTNNSVLVPFGLYSANSQVLTQQINALQPGQFGQSTNSADGLGLVYSSLIQAKQQYPQDTFSLVYFTDGVPENAACEFVDESEEYHANNGSGPICATSFQTHPQYPVPISSQIKSLGVNIYTVALYKIPPYSAPIQNELVLTMQNVASNPSSTYYIGLPNADNLEQAYQTIAQRICQ